jgi:hypothetical protein
MSQAEDMTAIDEFMKRSAPVTPEATALRQSWLVWYPSLSWYQKSFDTDTRDEASTRRNKFNLANAKSQAEKDNVVRVITTGMDTNQMQGKARKQTLATGEVGTQIKKPTAATTLTGTHPTIKQGSSGPAVKEWQAFLGTTADGNFGTNTKALTIAWQKKWNTLPHSTGMSLTADGVVGPKTWTAALGTPPGEAIATKEEPGILASLFGPSDDDLNAQAKADAANRSVTSAIKAHPKVTAKAGGAASNTAPKAAVASATKPSTSKPSAASAGTSTSTGLVSVAQAGMFSSLGKLPLWAKIAGAAAVVGGLIFGRNAKMVNYHTGKEVKRKRAA